MNPVQMLWEACEALETKLFELFHKMDCVEDVMDCDLKNHCLILGKVKRMLQSFKDVHENLKRNEDGLLSKLVEAFIAQHFLLLQKVVKTDDLRSFIKDHFYKLDSQEPWGELVGFLAEKAHLVKRPMSPGTDIRIPRSIYYAVELSSVLTRDPQKTGDFLLGILKRLQDEASESKTLELFNHAMQLLTEEKMS